MKVHVHNNEVRPLIKEGYEKVYDAMSRLLTPEEMIFAEWKAGFGDVLQWSLPNDLEWRSLAHADSYDRQAVINEYLRLKESGEKKLGRNQKLIEQVYSVPSEASVYYAITPEGKYRVLLTGWGYSFPYQAPMTILSCAADPATQAVTLKFVDNGQPAPAIGFEIYRENGQVISHVSDGNGEKSLGNLYPGSVLYIGVPAANLQVPITVVKGKSHYTIDVTTVPQAEIPNVFDTPEEPQPQPDEEPLPEEEPQPELPVNDITIRLTDSVKGQPIAETEVILTQDGRRVAYTTDTAGQIYVSSSDYWPNNPSKLEIPRQTDYPPVDFTFDDGETQYEFIFTAQPKSMRWLEALLIIIGAIVAIAALWLWLWKMCPVVL